MNLSFKDLEKLHDNDRLEELSINPYGILWLKIKSLSRKEILSEYLAYASISLQSKKIKEQFEELYMKYTNDKLQGIEKIDLFIRKKNKEQFEKINIEDIVSELYKLKSFDRGGDYKNSLDRYLVDRYVKYYSSYDMLVSKFDTDIARAVQGYVLCSWYNHRSSILIEHIFKSHNTILPTVGQIKKVDFFINNIPFDLKVTYLPGNYIAKRRKELGLPPELNELKKGAKELGILFNNKNKPSDIYYEIVEKMRDKGSKESSLCLEKIQKVRMNIVEEVQKNPRLLIQNLYEEQGEMRFDSSNRLFLILIDKSDFDNSRKLKRNLDFLRPTITQYLDNFNQKKIEDLKLQFLYKKSGGLKSYTAYSDCIFVIK